MNQHKICIVAAIGENGEIGQNNDLPWRGQVQGELAWFKEVTTHHFSDNTIVYGRKTFESLGSKPLPNRRNIVISHKLRQPAPQHVCGFEVRLSLRNACLEAQGHGSKVFVIGGSGIFKEAMEFADEMWLSHIPGKFPGADTFFPFMNPQAWVQIEAREFPNFTAVKYWRR